MELLTLDSSFQSVAYLPYINLQWDREYYTAGQFSVQIPAANYDPSMTYLYTPDRPEMGIIQKVALEETVKGRFVQLSGFFLEKLLDDKIVYPTYYATGALDTAVTAMVETYKDDIPLLSVQSAPGLGTSATWQETGAALGTAAYTRLETQEMSLRCRYNYQESIIYFSIWQGVDRTQDQSENNFVVFSDGFRNLSEVQASVDSSNDKNYAVVAGEGEEDARKIAIVDLSDGGYQRRVFIDARNERWDTDEQTEDEYLESLRQYGLEKMLNYQTVRNIEVDVTQGPFRYLEDFDLGDKVDVIIRDIGLAITARVVSVHEVHKQNTMTLSIELGNKTLSTLTKARLK